jgi:hypothetical protein
MSCYCVELALFVLSHALRSQWRTMVEMRLVRNLPHAEVWLFVVAMGVIMHAYIRRPSLLRRTYLSLFRWFFGSSGTEIGHSQHRKVHSSSDLAAHGGATGSPSLEPAATANVEPPESLLLPPSSAVVANAAPASASILGAPSTAVSSIPSISPSAAADMSLSSIPGDGSTSARRGKRAPPASGPIEEEHMTPGSDE